MSRRFRRALLVLYPPRFRRRYGTELLQLQDELRREGKLSRVRLTRDAVAGAFIARSPHQRALIAGSGLLIATLIAAATTLGESGRHSPAMPRAQLAAVAVTPTRPALPYGRSCFVGAGTSCSLDACVQFTASPQTSTTVAAQAPGHNKRDSSQATTACVSDRHARHPQGRSLFVTGARRTHTTHQPNTRPAAAHPSTTLASTSS